MKKGLVYILTNPCLDGWVKIGMTERNDIEQRLKELNTPTNLPLSYRCYATYEVEEPLVVEKKIHSLIDRVDNSLHAREQLSNGRVREREFFKISPETAFGIFSDVATLRSDRENLKPYAPTEEQEQEADIGSSKVKRSNNSFKLLGIPVGDEINFLLDDRISVNVVNEKNKVSYNGEEYSVTALAIKLLIENHGWAESTRANGWQYFVKDGITLSQLREKVELANFMDC